jgi:hypothetical protein
MMGEGTIRVARGDAVEVNIRNIGWVEGSVAWVQDDRFGVAFGTEIDPKVARAPLAASGQTPSPLHRQTPRNTKALRKI